MIENFYQDVLDTCLGDHEKLVSFQSVGGGCINNTIKLVTETNTYFLKWNSADALDMFEKEHKGLLLLGEHTQLKVPEVLNSGLSHDKSFLLLEWVEKGRMDNQFWSDFGVGLARMHQSSASHFGLDHDNFIGSLHQSNSMHDSWSSFFINERLKPQIALANQKGLIQSDLITKFEKLYLQLDNLVPKEAPALLHGDLWSGNFSSSTPNQPTIFDPAVYYGHRETELAFTNMFGGFSLEFYHYYQVEFPLEPGFNDRMDIHNLYPLLVHVNLFGSSYLSGVIQTLRKYT